MLPGYKLTGLTPVCIFKYYKKTLASKQKIDFIGVFSDGQKTHKCRGINHYWAIMTQEFYVYYFV